MFILYIDLYRITASTVQYYIEVMGFANNNKCKKNNQQQK